MKHALGISIHTGWGACVVVGGTPSRPEIVANEVVHVLGDEDRFCYHMASEMERGVAARFLARTRRKALANAKRALAPLLARQVRRCGVVAKPGSFDDLDAALASHPNLHRAEGYFYRDVFREACGARASVVPPASLDPSRVGKLAPPPWGRDQRLAALAAWTVLRS